MSPSLNCSVGSTHKQMAKHEREMGQIHVTVASLADDQRVSGRAAKLKVPGKCQGEEGEV